MSLCIVTEVDYRLSRTSPFPKLGIYGAGMSNLEQVPTGLRRLQRSFRGACLVYRQAQPAPFESLRAAPSLAGTACTFSAAFTAIAMSAVDVRCHLNTVEEASSGTVNCRWCSICWAACANQQLAGAVYRTFVLMLCGNENAVKALAAGVSRLHRDELGWRRRYTWFPRGVA